MAKYLLDTNIVLRCKKVKLPVLGKKARLESFHAARSRGNFGQNRKEVFFS